MRWVDGMKYAKNMNLGKLCEILRAREAWWLQSMAPQGLDMTGQLNNDDFAWYRIFDSFDYQDFDYIISLPESIHCVS